MVPRKQPHCDGSQGAAPDPRTRLHPAPCTLHPAATAAPLTGGESTPSQRPPGTGQVTLQELSASPLNRMLHASLSAFVWGSRRDDRSIIGLTDALPPHLYPACQFVFSFMFTQKPLPNPSTAMRVLLSHFIDEERLKEVK